MAFFFALVLLLVAVLLPVRAFGNFGATDTNAPGGLGDPNIETQTESMNTARETRGWTIPMGFFTTASAYYSTAMGYDTTATSQAEVAVGRYNEVSPSGGAASWRTTDAVFRVGWGSGPDDRKDALTVYKASLTPLIAHARATCSVMTSRPAHTHLTQTRIHPCTDTHTPTHWTV